MLPLTVAILARDESDRLPDAIASVSFADEILVLDSGSRDDSVRVARDLGARVVETDWPGHVAQKNRALQQAHHTWVLSLDADERVSAELALSIAAALSSDPEVSGFRCNRLSWWAGKALLHGTWYPDARIRLVRKDRACWVGEDPHDLLRVEGSVG
ncbi:MAG: glycosyltransferase family 2 protein, partial [Myxococcota bacterium]|nr:glycosyltransferase family 2 protein [Myxococcota bacterium]